MAYTILRFAKQKGNPARAIQAHHEREKEKYKSNPDINLSKSRDNIHIITPQMSYKKEIDSRILKSGCRVRKDSTRFVDTLITASPDFFKGKSKKDIIEYFRHAVDFMKSKVRADCIFTAVIHLDERTPHMHLCFVPITEDNRLTAKEILGNRVKLSKWQDEFHGYMSKFYPDLERGISAQLTGRKHIPSNIFKSAQRLQKMQLQIEELLENTHILNSGKNSKKALELLEKWVPMVETFETQINMLSKSLKDSEQEKRFLSKELNERKEMTFHYQLELSGLKSELNKMQRLYSKVPEEIRTEIETRKKKRDKEAER